MEYTKQTWTAPTGTGLSRYAKSAESASHVTLTLDPENLTNTPTPFTADRMAHMEEGIAKAYDTAPPTPWAQYSGKDIPQLPDNLAGTTYKRDNDWVDVDGWTASGGTVSVGDNKLICISSTSDFFITKSGFSFSGASNRFIYLYLSECPAGNNLGQVYYTTSGHGISASYYKTFIITKKGIYILDMGVLSSGDNDWITSTITGLRIDLGSQTGQTFILQSIYTGTGAYDRLVFDNSYHYRHLLNNAVVPTPQGLYFNGTTSYLRSKEKVTLPDVFTFSATVNCAIKSTTQMLFAHGTSATISVPYCLIYRRTNTDTLIVYGTDGTVFVEAFLGTNYFTGLDNTDIKTEVTIDFINKTIKVYRNNVQFGTTASAPTMLKPDTDYIYFGDYVTGIGKLLGYMRNICIFDTALTDTQRNWLAQGNTPPILYDVTNYETEGYVSIQDADGTNTGVAVSVDSNGNRILKLPATIKANVTGSAGTVSKANVRVSLRHGNTWFDKVWGGKSSIAGDRIWTDGENIYYSNGQDEQYVLNKSTSTWVAKTWNGYKNLSGITIWTDGENIYHSYGTAHHVLNKATYTWTTKTWAGLTDFNGKYIWTDGENIYYSNGAQQFVLNKLTSTWAPKAWTGLTDFIGENIWTDGENIYHSNGTTQFVLNKATYTWVVKTWTGLTNFTGHTIWTDGENIYYSYTTNQFVLNKATYTWVVKTWTGLTEFYGNNNIWTDGENIYYNLASQVVLPATRHNYIDDDKYNSLFGTTIKCNCSTLSDRFVFRNE